MQTPSRVTLQNHYNIYTGLHRYRYMYAYSTAQNPRGWTETLAIQYEIPKRSDHGRPFGV
jgi:hypothetical protein